MHPRRWPRAFGEKKTLHIHAEVDCSARGKGCRSSVTRFKAYWDFKVVRTPEPERQSRPGEKVVRVRACNPSTTYDRANQPSPRRQQCHRASLCCRCSRDPRPALWCTPLGRRTCRPGSLGLGYSGRLETAYPRCRKPAGGSARDAALRQRELGGSGKFSPWGQFSPAAPIV
jgi:hypothetical protein